MLQARIQGITHLFLGILFHEINNVMLITPSMRQYYVEKIKGFTSNIPRVYREIHYFIICTINLTAKL